jgi:hypothetical protein
VAIKVVRNQQTYAGLQNLIQSARSTAKVGWPDSAQYDTGEKVADVALKQEFGGMSELKGKTRVIPPRPFLRNTISRENKNWLHAMEEGSKAVLNNSIKFEDVLGFVAAKAVEDVRDTVQAFVPPPLSEYTIKRRADKAKPGGKVNDLPLYDTGRMMGTLTSEVEIK